MNTSMLKLILSTAVALAALSGRADACSMAFVDFFTRFDDTAIVAEVKVSSISDKGEVALRRLKWIKGATKAGLAGAQGGMCPPTYEKDQHVIAFFDAKGMASWIEGSPKAVATTLLKWGTLKTDAARRTYLTKLSKSKNEVLRLHAEERLKIETAKLTTTPSKGG